MTVAQESRAQESRAQESRAQGNGTRTVGPDAGLVVVGSGPGGLGAATTYRDLRPSSPVTILTADDRLPYDRPPLSKDFLRRETSADDIALQDEGWYGEHRITVRTGVDVESIDPRAHTVTLAGGETVGYASLVLATGAEPVVPPITGVGDHAFFLRNLDDATDLRDKAADADSAVVIGSGFIGCEVAASLASIGVATTIVAPEEVPQQARLGREAGERILGFLQQAGVSYTGGVTVEAVESGVVRLGGGVAIDTDLVVAATGIRSSSGLAKAAGITLADGRVAVDEFMRTDVADVYAAGDVASPVNATAGRRIPTEHWDDSSAQGEIAGAAAAGQQRAWDAVPTFWSDIGSASIQYGGWGDGYDDDHLVDRGDGALAVWYRTGDVTVGALTVSDDEDYQIALKLIAEKRPPAG
ncbi:NAD(P)/FAD-dependent oxidoreductase [Williamsia sterculiae]|uniref:Reductase C-terminal n=1 Tax=Williamsia sterculiae TaxID=1344003 RepID=A0A1N7GNX4_9NOCA|nr:FAD-dependent oxidoreductase [Williamsia sterculiae]SIS14270.1 Reductase C-terminal [Williamsia sterculiae]